jgi:UDP-2,3-diacylglucosamine hydrolase
MLDVRGKARFVSDLHLRAERPDLSGRFFSFLENTADRGVDALFILGDLFEYWIGDDDLDDAFNRSVAWQLRQLVTHGTRVFFLAGNRDFLVGPRFAAETGIELLPDTKKVGAGGTATLLLHGDTLCTDDLPYQEFRRLVRSQTWQQQFLDRSLAERRAEVARLRQRSAEAMEAKTVAIMDVNAETVRAAFAESACRRMIHGHTHRPGHHTSAMAPDCERWVLSDWERNRGDVLEVDSTGVRRLDLAR